MKEFYSIQNEVATGGVILKNQELTYNLGGRSFKIQASYVSSLELIAKLPLSKVKARMTYYTLMGDKQAIEFNINENDFKALKQNLNK